MSAKTVGMFSVFTLAIAASAPCFGQSFRKGRAGDEIYSVVLHTLEGSAESAIRFMRAGGKASVHYVVDHDGEVTQFVADEDTAFHARGRNTSSIGIAYAGFAAREAWDDRQLLASALITARICDTYKTVARTYPGITGHSDFSDRHTDPGPNFPWPRFMAMVRLASLPEALNALGYAPPSASAIVAALLAGGVDGLPQGESGGGSGEAPDSQGFADTLLGAAAFSAYALRRSLTDAAREGRAAQGGDSSAGGEPGASAEAPPATVGWWDDALAPLRAFSEGGHDRRGTAQSTLSAFDVQLRSRPADRDRLRQATSPDQAVEALGFARGTEQYPGPAVAGENLVRAARA